MTERTSAIDGAATDATSVDAGVTSYSIRSVDRVCDILDVLSDADEGRTLIELAELTGLPKSSAFRYLAALERRHYVERAEATQEYRLGRAFRPRNLHALDRLLRVAEPILVELTAVLGETTNVGILDGTMIVHAAVVESPQTMRLAARVGERGFVHATALGKAIAATLPAEQVHSIVAAAGMPGLTVATITEPAALDTELARVRVQRYALDDGENQSDGRCVAVALGGLPIPAGISVSAPAHRFSTADAADAARQLDRAARAIVDAFNR